MGSIESLRKWKAKLPPGLAFTGEEEFEASAVQREEIDQLVSQTSVPVTETASFTAFASEIQSIKNKHSGAIAQTEANIAKQRWAARGLDNTKLTSVLTHFNL